MARRSVARLGKLLPGSRLAESLLPIYRSEKGRRTFSEVSAGGSRNIRDPSRRYFDTVTGREISKRQRDEAISGWVSLEQKAAARKLNPNVLPPVARTPISDVEYTATPSGGYEVSGLPPQEVISEIAPPADYAVTSDGGYRYDPIDDVVDRMVSQFNQEYLLLQAEKGVEVDPYMLEYLDDTLEGMVRARRAEADNIFWEPDTSQYLKDELNEFLMESLEFDDVSDFWEDLYPLGG